MQFSIIFFSPEILGFISLKSCKLKTNICEKHCVEASNVISAESGEDIFYSTVVLCCFGCSGDVSTCYCKVVLQKTERFYSVERLVSKSVSIGNWILSWYCSAV